MCGSCWMQCRSCSDDDDENDDGEGEDVTAHWKMGCTAETEDRVRRYGFADENVDPVKPGATRHHDHVPESPCSVQDRCPHFQVGCPARTLASLR
eukprot:777947-Rhodomonas_salina.2